MNGVDTTPDDAGAPATSRAWLIIFTDLVSLMLTFFVLLFSMSSMETEHWQSTVQSLTRTLNPERSERPTPASAPLNAETAIRNDATHLDYLAALVDDALRQHPVLGRTRALRQDDRLIIPLPADLLFEADLATLSETGTQALFTLGGLLGGIDNRMGVLSHAPFDPKTNDDGPDWELALSRAQLAAASLRGSGYRDGIVTSAITAAPDIGRGIDIIIFAEKKGD